MGGDASTSEDEGDRGIVVTTVEHHEPTAASIGGGQDMEKRGDIPKSRKSAMSEDTVVEREAKRARSPHNSEASLVPYPPALSMAGHLGRSKEHVHSPVSSGSACVRDPQQGDAPLVAPVGAP